MQVRSEAEDIKEYKKDFDTYEVYVIVVIWAISFYTTEVVAKPHSLMKSRSQALWNFPYQDLETTGEYSYEGEVIYEPDDEAHNECVICLDDL